MYRRFHAGITVSQEHPFIPLDASIPADPAAASTEFLALMQRRRTVRAFSSRSVPRSLIEAAIATAGTAPSGAHKQPWRFVAVQDSNIKKEIRVAAEAEEREFYQRRASDTWLQDLQPFRTDANKPFLETAPWLIAVFKCMKDLSPGADSEQVYYVNESVGIAVGFLLAALHHAGLVALTHTPSPMKFLGTILQRPSYERAFLLIPVGWPADDCTVPDIHRKPLSEIMIVDRPDPPD
ncbi:MAG: nitroreductase family protein [Phycisphaerales bacterium]|jgi:nitroreductase|nr:nitroreductase family protein [Phycisphaerales bacterium]